MIPVRHRTSAVALVAAGLVPLIAFTSSPAAAAECQPRAGTFLPGDWTGYGYRDLYSRTEGLFVDASEEGAFVLTVDEGGAVEGSLDISGGGVSTSQAVIGASTGAWHATADLFGSASQVRLSGALTFAVDGFLDMGSSGDVGFDYGLERELSGTFAPLEADCTMAWGTFEGAGVGDGIAWVASRSGDTATQKEYLDRFTRVVFHAQGVLEDSEPDPAEVDLAVRQAIALNDLVGQATACGEVSKDIAVGSPAAAFARETLAGVLERFLETARDAGAYDTAAVVQTVALGLQAGLFDAPECGADAAAQQTRARLLALLHDVLAARLELVSKDEDPAHHATILVAAHQFGFLDLLEKMS